MKKVLNVLLVLILLLGFESVFAQTSKKEIGTCKNVHTNYFFLLEANTSSFFNESVTKSNIGTFSSNTYRQKFDMSNVGYGQIEINKSSTTSSDNITSWSLYDYYNNLLKINSNDIYENGSYTYVGHSKWYDEIYNTDRRIERSGSFSVEDININDLISASVDADTTIERESEISYDNPVMSLKITRSYNGTQGAKGISSNGHTWYLQPEVYYVQYCMDNNETYKVVYDKNTTEEVTKMPENKEVSVLENVNISDMIPERSGYKFVGWSTSPTNNGKSFSANELYTDRKDLTLYAIWEEEGMPTPPVENPQTAIKDTYLLPVIGFIALTIGLLVLQYKKGFLKQL